MAVKPFVFFSDLEFFTCFLPAIMIGSLSLTKMVCRYLHQSFDSHIFVRNLAHDPSSKLHLRLVPLGLVRPDGDAGVRLPGQWAV